MAMNRIQFQSGLSLSELNKLYDTETLCEMLTGFARYSKDSIFAVLGKNREFILWLPGHFLGHS